MLLSGGLIDAALLRRRAARLPDEVFASELLSRPVTLSCSGRRLQVTIDRHDVQRAVISNAGKRALCEQHLQGRRAALLEADRRLHAFLSGERYEGTAMQTPPGLPLRWASGGVLSVVRFRGRRWVPLVFRDIPPVGWNLCLGSSQRDFDRPAGRYTPYERLQQELREPLRFIEREFLEEAMVLEREPEPGVPVHRRELALGSFSGSGAVAQADRHSAAHRALRVRDDGFAFGHSARPIEVRCGPPTAVDLIVRSPQRARPSRLRDVLVSINLLELGIEVVQVLEYELDPGNVMLDGEIREAGGQAMLVRMPVALVAESYLRRAFGSAEVPLAYTRERVQPSVQALPIGPRDIVPFGWDLQRRAELTARGGDPRWRRTWATWLRRFAADFDQGRFPALFTPAAAKILACHFLNPRRPPR